MKKKSTCIDLTGKRFERLTVIERDGSWTSRDGSTTTPIWRCVCDCGNETWVLGRNLKSGATKSCGCLRRERSIERLIKAREKRNDKRFW